MLLLRLLVFKPITLNHLVLEAHLPPKTSVAETAPAQTTGRGDKEDIAINIFTTTTKRMPTIIFPLPKKTKKKENNEKKDKTKTSKQQNPMAKQKRNSSDLEIIAATLALEKKFEREKRLKKVEEIRKQEEEKKNKKEEIAKKKILAKVPRKHE